MAARDSGVNGYILLSLLAYLASLTGDGEAATTCNAEVSSSEDLNGRQICTKKGLCNKPFVEFPPTSPTISPSSTFKTFQNSLTFINTTELNVIIVTSTINDFHRNISQLQGFISSQIISVGTDWVRYEVQYNYAELNASASANPDADDLIRNTIGNITYVAEGFSNNTEFSSLYEIDTSKDNDFTGNCLCENASTICAGFQDFDCFATSNGVSVSCLTSSPYCYNGGYCFKSESQQCVCSCQNTLNYWYVGDRCETWLHIWMVIVFFVVVGLLLFLVIPLVTLCFMRTIDERILKEQGKEEKRKLKAAAKERQQIEEKAEKEIKTSKNSNTAIINGEAAAEAVPVAAPRQNVTMLHESSHVDANSFSDSTAATTSNPSQTNRKPTRKASYINSTSLKKSDKSSEREVNPYATILNQASPPNLESSSSSSDGSTATNGFHSGDVSLPPIPYHNPPSYISPETIQKNKQYRTPFSSKISHYATAEANGYNGVKQIVICRARVAVKPIQRLSPI